MMSLLKTVLLWVILPIVVGVVSADLFSLLPRLSLWLARLATRLLPKHSREFYSWEADLFDHLTHEGVRYRSRFGVLARALLILSAIAPVVSTTERLRSLRRSRSLFRTAASAVFRALGCAGIAVGAVVLGQGFEAVVTASELAASAETTDGILVRLEDALHQQDTDAVREAREQSRQLQLDLEALVSNSRRLVVGGVAEMLLGSLCLSLARLQRVQQGSKLRADPLIRRVTAAVVPAAICVVWNVDGGPFAWISAFVGGFGVVLWALERRLVILRDAITSAGPERHVEVN